MRDQKVVLITGASRGIGAATARLAATQGYAVAVNYAANRNAAQNVVADIRAAGGTALAVQADVSSEADVKRMFAAVDDEFGRLDALVNNAGIVARSSRLEQMTSERMQRILAVNVLGPLLCTREAILRMSTAHGGRGGAIVNVSSMAARFGSPGEYVDYAASKGAIDTLTLGLARELAADGIRVNAVRPGIVDTEIHSHSDPLRLERLLPRIPAGRLGKAEEIAAAIMALISEEASYTSGALVDVSGGL